MPDVAPPAPSTVATPEPRPTPSTVATTEPSTAPPLTRPTPAARPMAPRYQYVIADLRKIGLIAGAMLVILIVLAFVLG